MGIIFTIVGGIAAIWLILSVLTTVGIMVKAKKEVDQETEEILRREGVVKIRCPNCKAKRYCSLHEAEYMGTTGTIANCTTCHNNFGVSLNQ